MRKNISCHCSFGCDTKQCPCLKAGRACNDGCGCHDCNNPLNNAHIDQVSQCAVYNIEKFKCLTKKELEQEMELPCGCESLPMKMLLGSYKCEQCNKVYHYSFYFNSIIEEGLAWNCEFCGGC